MFTNAVIEFAILILLALAPSSALALNSPQTNQKTQTLTGCVQRGEPVSAYKLVANDGIWNLGGSAKLKLGRDVGHTVTVKANVVESFDQKPEDQGADPNIRGILDVTKIAKVSSACGD